MKVDALVVGIILVWPLLLWCYGPEGYHYYELRSLTGDKSASLIIENDETLVYLDGRRLEKGVYAVSPGEHTFGFEMLNVRYNGRTVTFEPDYTYKLN